ncbi:phosphotransferase [Streptomyces sp. B6B3]|uniref:phosphotransferase n=1 Tax=Streptomyces sp. B6B3 TaxID=3153570 RepID=UPI00325D6938
MARGELLGTGRTADVFALDDHRVLRRYRAGTDATAEARVMAHVAAHGYPVPAVFPGDGDPARGDLVLERLAGPTLATAVVAGEVTAERAGTMLAGLLNALHRLPPRPEDEPGARVLHLDLHPENVLLTPRGPMVIDWANAVAGPPGYDRAVSALILAEVVAGEHPLADAAHRMLAELLPGLDAAGGPADRDGWPADLARAHALRAANATLSAEERARLGEAVALVGTLSPAAGSSGRATR